MCFRGPSPYLVETCSNGSRFPIESRKRFSCNVTNLRDPGLTRVQRIESGLRAGHESAVYNGLFCIRRRRARANATRGSFVGALRYRQFAKSVFYSVVTARDSLSPRRATMILSARGTTRPWRHRAFPCSSYRTRSLFIITVVGSVDGGRRYENICTGCRRVPDLETWWARFSIASDVVQRRICCVIVYHEITFHWKVWSKERNRVEWSEPKNTINDYAPITPNDNLFVFKITTNVLYSNKCTLPDFVIVRFSTIY